MRWQFLHLVLSFYTFSLHSFEKVVIWGHKLHSHTHSYVHKGFYDAFVDLGYDTYWFDSHDDMGDFDCSHTLFLTEGQVDQNIPLREDCIYLLHNCDHQKYKSLTCVTLQVYTDDVLKRSDMMQIAPCIYWNIANKELIFPWATDLLPQEIEQIKHDLAVVQKEKVVYWIGTLGEGYFGNLSELQPFMVACEERGIPFVTPNPSATGIEAIEHQRLITSAYLAPAIVGRWQKQVGYIPCRIFKNISYGQLGVTNSRQVYELFERKIVYNPDTYQLFYDAEERLQTITREEIFELMDLIKENHTYLNRIKTIFDFFKQLNICIENNSK